MIYRDGNIYHCAIGCNVITRRFRPFFIWFNRASPYWFFSSTLAVRSRRLYMRECKNCKCFFSAIRLLWPHSINRTEYSWCFGSDNIRLSHCSADFAEKLESLLLARPFSASVEQSQCVYLYNVIALNFTCAILVSNTRGNETFSALNKCRRERRMALKKWQRWKKHICNDCRKSCGHIIRMAASTSRARPFLCLCMCVCEAEGQKDKMKQKKRVAVVSSLIYLSNVSTYYLFTNETRV